MWEVVQRVVVVWAMAMIMAATVMCTETTEQRKEGTVVSEAI